MKSKQLGKAVKTTSKQGVHFPWLPGKKQVIVHIQWFRTETAWRRVRQPMVLSFGAGDAPSWGARESWAPAPQEQWCRKEPVSGSCSQVVPRMYQKSSSHQAQLKAESEGVHQLQKLEMSRPLAGSLPSGLNLSSLEPEMIYFSFPHNSLKQFWF